MAGPNPAMLTLVREYRGLTQSDLASRAGLTQGYISKAENGIFEPPRDTVERLAEALDWPVDFFYRTDQVYGFGSACIFHRKQATLPVGALRLVHAAANVLRIGITPLLRDVAIDAANAFPTLDIDEYGGSPQRIAQMVRASWGLPLGPVGNLVAALESAGGIVYRISFGTRQLDAVSHWPPNMPPVILLNADASGDRLRFSLAHELGHMVMHRIPNQEMEKEADQFAAEFLMPAREIRSDLLRLDLTKAAQLKPYWKVSMAALVLRARDLGVIAPGRAKGLYAQLSRLGYRLMEPVEVPTEAPTLVTAIMNLHQQEHEYSVEDLVSIAGLPAEEFRSLFGEKPRLHAVK
jgi:Zn-dependent peptidase ImmA (M78 family)/DNA-binding XRE family transcriptional regulator